MKAQARHILVKTAEEAEQLKQRIANGEAFDTRPARPANAAVIWVKCARGRWSVRLMR
jgi:BMFP domain-containing protein YqiC